MKLFEILSKKITDFEVLNDSTLEYEAQAKIGDRVIRFLGARMSKEPGQDLWHVEFSEDLPSGRHTYELTKSGKEFDVFSFIAQCFEEMIKKRHPQTIRFTADKTSGSDRASLYEKMIKKYLKGYKLKVMDDGSRQVKFTLEKE
jgi:hypothetical protein